MTVMPCGSSSAAQTSGSTFCAVLTACDMRLPPPPIMSASVTSAMGPRFAGIIARAACFAIMIREVGPCRKIASAVVRSASEEAVGPISGSSPATLSTTTSMRPWPRRMRLNSAFTSASFV